MRIFRKQKPPAGARPGTIVVPEAAPRPRIHLIDYTAARIEERDIDDPEELRAVAESPSVSWIDVQGLGDEDVLRRIAEIFSLHVLVLEEIANVGQRPKFEAFDGTLLFVSRMVWLEPTLELHREQFSLVLGKNYLITFQEQHGDNLDPVRRRLRGGQGPMRGAGADYLAYAILDAIVDGYFPVLEEVGDELERIEERILRRPAPELLGRVNRIRSMLLVLRRAIWPQRDAFTALAREGNALVRARTRPYFRDVQDHCFQIAEVTEAYRELASGLVSTHLSVLSNRTNDIMKVLTIMASIFIPLTFLAGIYGMNFDFMPELRYKWSYPLLLLVMAAVTGGMIFAFRRRGWLGGEGSGGEEEAGRAGRDQAAGE